MLFVHKSQTCSAVRLRIAVLMLMGFIFFMLSSVQAEEKEASNFSNDSDNTYEDLKIFSEVLSLIESSYVETCLTL